MDRWTHRVGSEQDSSALVPKSWVRMSCLFSTADSTLQVLQFAWGGTRTEVPGAITQTCSVWSSTGTSTLASSVSSLLSPLDGFVWQRTWGTRRVSPASAYLRPCEYWMPCVMCILCVPHIFGASWVLGPPLSSSLFYSNLFIYSKHILSFIHPIHFLIFYSIIE